MGLGSMGMGRCDGTVQEDGAIPLACLVALWCLLQASATQAEELRGRVVAVTNGDTLRILVPSNRQMKVKLANVDAPTKGQPYNQQSMKALATLIFNKFVTVKVQTIDPYGRTVSRVFDPYGRIVGRVYQGHVDVCAELLRQGAAWVSRRSAQDHNLFVLEEEARQQRAGIWSLPESERLPPWEWDTIKPLGHRAPW